MCSEVCGVRRARKDEAAQKAVEQQLMTELAAPVLEQTAVEQLVVLGDTEQEYFACLLATANRERCDEPLDFGPDVRAGFLGLAVVTPVTSRVSSLIVQGDSKAATPVVPDLTRRLFRGSRFGAAPKCASTVSALTPEQRCWLRDIRYETVQLPSLSDPQAVGSRRRDSWRFVRPELTDG